MTLAVQEAVRQIVGEEIPEGLELRNEPLRHNLQVVVDGEVIGMIDHELLMQRVREFEGARAAQWAAFDEQVNDPDIPQASMRRAFGQGIWEIVSKSPPPEIPGGLEYEVAGEEIEVRRDGKPLGFINIADMKDVAREHAAQQN
jgi:hypothetical protein